MELGRRDSEINFWKRQWMGVLERGIYVYNSFVGRYWGKLLTATAKQGLNCLGKVQMFRLFVWAYPRQQWASEVKRAEHYRWRSERNKAGVEHQNQSCLGGKRSHCRKSVLQPEGGITSKSKSAYITRQRENTFRIVDERECRNSTGNPQLYM